MITSIKKGEDFKSVPMAETVSKNRFRYGIWEFSRQDYRYSFQLTSLSRTGIEELLESEGFCKLKSNSQIIVREQNNIIEEVSISIIQEFMREFLERIPEDGHTVIYEGETVNATKLDMREVYARQNHLCINERQFGHFQILPLEILSDEKEVSYLPFLNGVVRITSCESRLIPYEELIDQCVWKEQRIPRLFDPSTNGSECEFVKFLMNVTDHQGDRFTSFKSALGYLMHTYSHPSGGQAVVLYDKNIDFNLPQGGTGKGVMANALKQIRFVTKIDGRRFKPGNQFNLQSVQSLTQIVWLDDVRQDFDFSTLFSSLTDGLTVERKHQSEILTPPEESPKILITSNSVFEIFGTSNKRRQFLLELSDHYSKQIKIGTEEPITAEHGGKFFDNDSWNQREWNNFYSFMIECIRFYLDNGLVACDTINVSMNRLSQATSVDFNEWTDAKAFVIDHKYETKPLFEEFILTYYGEDSKFSQRGFSKWLKAFAQTKGWRHRVTRSNGIQFFEFTVA